MPAHAWLGPQMLGAPKHPQGGAFAVDGHSPYLLLMHRSFGTRIIFKYIHIHGLLGNILCRSTRSPLRSPSLAEGEGHRPHRGFQGQGGERKTLEAAVGSAPDLRFQVWAPNFGPYPLLSCLCVLLIKSMDPYWYMVLVGIQGLLLRAQGPLVIIDANRSPVV